MTSHRRLPITRSSRRDQQRPQLPIDVEVTQMRPDQMKRLSPTRRQHFPGVLLASRRTRKHRALRDDTKQRQTVDRLQILRLPDPPIKTLQQKSDAQTEQQTQHSAKGYVPRGLRRRRSRRNRRGLRDLDVAVLQFGEDPQRLDAVLHELEVVMKRRVPRPLAPCWREAGSCRPGRTRGDELRTQSPQSRSGSSRGG
jgi:hypothetical protein